MISRIHQRKQSNQSGAQLFSAKNRRAKVIAAAFLGLFTMTRAAGQGVVTVSGDLNYNSGSQIDWRLYENSTATRGTDYDGVDVTGNLDFVGTTQLNLDFSTGNVNWSDSFWDTPRTGTNGWLLFDHTSSGTTSNAAQNLAINQPSNDGQGVSLVSSRSITFNFEEVGEQIYIVYDYDALSWTGASSTDWAVGNFSSAFIPVTHNALTIPDVSSGSNNYPVVDESIAFKSLLIESNATLTLLEGASTGANSIVNNGSVVASPSTAITIANSVSGTGSLSHSGSGTTTLSGHNTYTGGTTVSAGTLELTYASSGNGTVRGVIQVGAGAALEVGADDVFGYQNNNLVTQLNINGGTVTGNYQNRFGNSDNLFTLNMTAGSRLELGGTAGGATANDFYSPTISVTGTGTASIARTSSNTTASMRLRYIGDNPSTPGVCTLDVATGATLDLEVPITSGDAGSTTGTGGASVVKSGDGSLVLKEVSAYTGPTVLAGGELVMGIDNALSSSSQLVLDGGVFKVNGKNGQMATLQLQSNSEIDFANSTSNSHTMSFDNSSGQTWGSPAQLVISNWEQGETVLKVGTDAQGLTSTQLSLIHFNGYGAGARITASGEVIPAEYLTDASGDATSTASWYGGGTPSSISDRVRIQNGHTITATNSFQGHYGDLKIENAASLILQAGATLEVTDSLTLDGQVLTIEADATDGYGQLKFNSLHGSSPTITMEMVISGQGWHQLSVPVAGQSASIFGMVGDDLHVNTQNLFYWDVANYTWAEVIDGTVNLTDGRGYYGYYGGIGGLDQTTGPWTITATGTPLASVSAPLQHGVASGGGWSDFVDVNQTDGWNLVANPFSCVLDFEQLGFATNSSINNAFYLYNPANTGYSSYSAGGITSPEIAPFQSFWVQTTGNPGSVTFNMQSHGKISTSPPGFMKAAEVTFDRVVLQVAEVQEPANSDYTVVALKPGNTVAYDSEWDAHKFLNGGDLPNIYTTYNDQRLSVNAVDYCAAYQHHLELPIAFKSPKHQELYQLHWVDSFMIFNYHLEIEDRLLGVYHDLNSNPNYLFVSDTTMIDRFALHINRSDLGVADGAQGQAFYAWVPVEGDQLKINSAFDGICEVQVFDARGRAIAQSQVEVNRNSIVSFALPPCDAGVYTAILRFNNHQQNLRYVKP